MRPRVRCADWHAILDGPRLRDDGAEIPTADRKRDLRWMPLIPVALAELARLPVGPTREAARMVFLERLRASDAAAVVGCLPQSLSLALRLCRRPGELAKVVAPAS